jgi:hypothetical protein
MTTKQYYIQTLVFCFLLGLFLPVSWGFLAVGLLGVLATFYRGDLFLKYVRVVVPVLIVTTTLISMLSSTMNLALGGRICNSFIPVVDQQGQVYIGSEVQIGAGDMFVRKLLAINSRSLSRVVARSERHCPEDKLDDVLKEGIKNIVEALPMYTISMIVIHGVSFAIFRSRQSTLSSSVVNKV